MYIATDKKGNEYRLTEDQVAVWKRCGYEVHEEEPEGKPEEAAKKAEPKKEAAKKAE